MNKYLYDTGFEKRIISMISTVTNETEFIGCVSDAMFITSSICILLLVLTEFTSLNTDQLTFKIDSNNCKSMIMIKFKYIDDIIYNTKCNHKQEYNKL